MHLTLLKRRFVGLISVVSDQAGLWRDPRICISNKFPGDAGAPHLRNMLFLGTLILGYISLFLVPVFVTFKKQS